MKIQIKVASNIRGFLNELFDHSFENIEFLCTRSGVELTGAKHKFLRKLFESRLFDLLGIIQVLRRKTDSSAMISYNRFMFTNKPYYIICENPTALFHYRLSRNKGIVARYLIPRMLNDDNLKGIICISEACASTFENVHGIKSDKIYQIYPMIKDVLVSRQANLDKPLRCLFVSSNFELKSGCEIVKAAKMLPTVNFKLITVIDKIPVQTLAEIKSLANVSLVEFNLSKDELYKLYREADVLLHPTRQDSSALVVLEAIKHGLPVLTTSIYAIPEMVIDGYNGYLTEPKYWFFDKYNMPNSKVWNHREDTIYSKYLDENIINFLVEKLDFLDKNRQVLQEFSNHSLALSKNIFGEALIQKKWEQMVEKTLCNR